MRLASVLSLWPRVRSLGRRLPTSSDLDPDEAGPTPLTVSPSEEAELVAARPFQKLGGPIAWPLVGSAGAFIGADTSRMDEIFSRLRTRHGDLYRLQHPLRGHESVVAFTAQDAEKLYRNEGIWPIRPGFHPVRMYNRIHGLKNGLLASNGGEWSELRSVAQQQFLRANAFQPFIPHMERSAADLVAALAADRDPQQRLNRDFMRHSDRATLDVMQKVSCGIDAYKDPDEHCEMLRHLRCFMGLITTMEMSINTWRYIANSQWKRFTQVLDCFNAITEEWMKIALSQNSHSESNMVLMLMEKGITREQMKALLIDLLTGGVETSSVTLTYLLYRLATNPECQERAQREVLQGVPPPGQTMTRAHINRLTYLRACIKENLRVNAPVMGIARKLGKDIVLGDYRIPKGKVVFMVNSMTSRSGAEFSEPERFLPERWLRCPAAEGAAPAPAAAAAASPFASLPFSHGPRMCIGRRLAEQELLIFIARILQRFRVEYTGRPIRFHVRVISRSADPLHFTLVDQEAQQKTQRR